MLMNRRIMSTLDHDRLIAALDRARRSWTTCAPNLNSSPLNSGASPHPSDVHRM